MFADFDIVPWVIMPILIFVARLADVSLATLRHIFIYKGLQRIVPVIAFIEVCIWLIAISQVMQNLTNIACFLAWAFGFSAGTYVGILIEEKIALGHQLVRVITDKNGEFLQEKIRALKYPVTIVRGAGSRGSVDILLIISERKKLKSLLKLLNQLSPKPFYTIEDVRNVMATNWVAAMSPDTSSSAETSEFPHAPVGAVIEKQP